MMIKLKNTIVAGLSALLLLGFSSCGDKVSGQQVTDGVLSIGTSSNNDIKAISKEGDSFFLKISTPDDWSLTVEPESAKEWVKASVWAGESIAKNLPIRIDIMENTDESRTAKLLLTSNGAYKQFTLSQAGIVIDKPTPGGGDKPTPGGGKEEPTPEPTPTPDGEHINGDVNLLELPKLAGETNNYFATLKTSDGTVNYSLEYDVDKRHPRWVAFQFNDITAQSNSTKRTDAWGWDGKYIPSSFSTDNWFSRTGYSRGHMVASSDRYYSRQANMQTFNYFNMTPQNQDHNGGIWNQQERLVQNWGRNPRFRDILYVAKGGTIKDGQIKSRKIRNIMVIPEYYFMAIVVKKGSEYHGIAFWTEHRGYSRSTSLRSTALSIDELEKKTGIDFFHNFPDEIENKFEAEAVGSYRWPGL